jgi:hypothetical protein
MTVHEKIKELEDRIAASAQMDANELNNYLESLRLCELIGIDFAAVSA